MGNCYEAAIWYLENKKYSVIPARKKVACVKWEPYTKRLPTLDELKAWWQQFPNADVAIITGEISGITVLDIDSEEGLQSLSEFIPEALEVPVVKTPRGGAGYHYYFSYTPGIPNKARILKGVDVRNNGGYVIAPPSMSGAYKWVE